MIVTRESLIHCYLAGLVHTKVITLDAAKRVAPCETNLGFAMGFYGEPDQSLYELPLLENSHKAIDHLCHTLGLSRDCLFIEDDKRVMVGRRARVIIA